MAHTEEQAYSYEHMQKIADVIGSKTKHKPKYLIICGSGLSGLCDTVEDAEVVDYKDVPHLPQSTVKGHHGRFVFGKIGSKVVVCMQGRFHPYEGYPLWKCAMPVRLMKLLGVTTLVVTNAAGGVNPDYKTGDIMLLKDHINFPGMGGNNPLNGPNDERWGPRFPAVNQAYDRSLRQLARDVAHEVGAEDLLREGVYCMLGGPNFETVAEILMLRRIGADACGMSTCHEVITAVHCGMKVVGFSLISNECVASYETEETANHQEVLETGQKRAEILKKLVTALLKKIPEQD